MQTAGRGSSSKALHEQGTARNPGSQSQSEMRSGGRKRPEHKVLWSLYWVGTLDVIPGVMGSHGELQAEEGRNLIYWEHHAGSCVKIVCWGWAWKQEHPLGRLLQKSMWNTQWLRSGGGSGGARGNCVWDKCWLTKEWDMKEREWSRIILDGTNRWWETPEWEQAYGGEKRNSVSDRFGLKYLLGSLQACPI